MRIAIAGFVVVAANGFPPIQAMAASPPKVSVPTPPVTYADLADLADSATLVLRADLRKIVPLEPAQARGVRSGWGRFYAEAKTRALISGNAMLGESLKYLVDLPLDAKGKPPKLGKKPVLLFAAPVAGRPGELRLVAPDAQLLWDAPTEARLRGVLTELLAPGAPGRIAGIREAIHVPGNLAGEGETQMFLASPGDGAVSVTVSHRPGMPVSWGVSFSEVLENGAPPRRETLAWYRLACFLPWKLPARANLSDSPEDKARAEDDYRLVRDALGACPRTRL